MARFYTVKVFTLFTVKPKEKPPDTRAVVLYDKRAL
jgi:hypothetical protein